MNITNIYMYVYINSPHFHQLVTLFILGVALRLAWLNMIPMIQLSRHYVCASTSWSKRSGCRGKGRHIPCLLCTLCRWSSYLRVIDDLDARHAQIYYIINHIDARWCKLISIDVMQFEVSPMDCGLRCCLRCCLWCCLRGCLRGCLRCCLGCCLGCWAAWRFAAWSWNNTPQEKVAQVLRLVAPWANHGK